MPGEVEHVVPETLANTLYKLYQFCVFLYFVFNSINLMSMTMWPNGK